MAFARIYDRWEDEATLSSALADGSAEAFDERRFVASRMWLCSARLEWLVLRGRSSEGCNGARGGRIVTSLATRIRSQYEGYESIFGDIRAEFVDTDGIFSVDIQGEWAFEIEIKDLLQAVLDESLGSLRWFVSVARWKGADEELVLSGNLGSDEVLLTPEEFKSGTVSGSIRPKKKVFNQIANQMFNEMRTYDVLHSKVVRWG